MNGISKPAGRPAISHTTLRLAPLGGRQEVREIQKTDTKSEQKSSFVNHQVLDKVCS